MYCLGFHQVFQLMYFAYAKYYEFEHYIVDPCRFEILKSGK